MTTELDVINTDVTGMDDMMSMMFMMVMMAFMATMLPQMQAQTQAQTQTLSAQQQQFIGVTTSRQVNADSTTRFVDLISNPPFMPWTYAFITNDGPDSAVFIGLNTPDGWLQIEPGETRTLAFAGADQKIRYIYYRTNAHEVASVRIEGQY